MTGLKNFKLYENHADGAIAAMPLAKLPARSFLAGIHYFLYTTQHAPLFGLSAQPGVAETTMTRMGYLLPLLELCPAVAQKGSARDAIGHFVGTDPTGEQLAQLLAYVHFSEFMPEVHKNYYSVEETSDGFRLTHPNESFAEAQARDILLSELALVFAFDNNRKLDPALHDIIESLPAINWEVLGPLLEEKTKRMLFSMAEPNLIKPDAMKRVFGYDYSTFYRIRAALRAYAEFALEMSMVLGAASHRDNGGKGVSDETLEWVSVEYHTSAFIELIAKLSRASCAEVERLLHLFSIDFRETPAAHFGGDGLFPPFARFESTLVFSPILVLSMVHLRNAIFVFSSMDDATYSAYVSQDLEPVLIGQTVELLRRSQRWILQRGMNYAEVDTAGEIDLIIAGESGEVLLVQAKGTLPPQGARLTERLAGRVREGVDQIERFRGLAPKVQEEIVSRAIGREVKHTEIRHGLLTRSCFGAVEIFDPASEITRLTLPLLSLALGEMRNAGDAADVETLRLRLGAVELRYFLDAHPRWEEGEIHLADRRMHMPLLKFDEALVGFIRRLHWSYSEISDPDDATN